MFYPPNDSLGSCQHHSNAVYPTIDAGQFYTKFQNLSLKWSKFTNPVLSWKLKCYLRVGDTDKNWPHIKHPRRRSWTHMTSIHGFECTQVNQNHISNPSNDLVLTINSHFMTQIIFYRFGLDLDVSDVSFCKLHKSGETFNNP